ncbi:MAG TPA: FlgD immunoglobulin-like domain containing protein, partial [Candidatus Krumholzibacteriaceae bacterium]
PPTPPVGPGSHEHSKQKRQIYPSGLSESRLGEPPEAPRIVCGPNPFNPSTWISIHGVSDANLTVSIYDAAGHGLCDLGARTNARGDGAVRWDGIDHGGAPLPSGVYFAVLKDGPRILARAKLVLAR